MQAPAGAACCAKWPRSGVFMRICCQSIDYLIAPDTGVRADLENVDWKVLCKKRLGNPEKQMFVFVGTKGFRSVYGLADQKDACLAVRQDVPREPAVIGWCAMYATVDPCEFCPQGCVQLAIMA